MSNSGIAVSRTSDPAQAREVVASVGAVILTGQTRSAGESWRDYGVRPALEVLGAEGVQVATLLDAASTCRGCL